MKISKITIGTAQLGMKYGIANINGKPDINSSINILNYAWNNGMNAFDTSPLYGNSEKIIGTFIKSKIPINNKNLVIISKLPKIEINNKITFDTLYNHIKNQVNKSLFDLNLKSIPIYLIHHIDDIFLKDGLIFECLNQLKLEGLIHNFGASIYSPEDVEALLNFKSCNVFQIPINIFDHRLINTGLLQKLQKKKYIILARSVFLQGLFFIPPKRLPNHLEIAKKPLKKLRAIVKEYDVEIDKLAFLFVRDLEQITSQIIGMENMDQLKKNLRLLNEKSLDKTIYNSIFDNFSDLPEKLINPYLWGK